MRWLFFLLTVLKLIPGNCQKAFIVPYEEALLIAEAIDARKTVLKESKGIILGIDSLPSIYIFNYKEGGTILISAEFHHEPLLAQLEKGRIEEGALPGGLLAWL